MIRSLRLTNTTVFERLEISFSPGVNVIIGENGAGKTHLLKFAYAVLRAASTRSDVAAKLVATFKPQNSALGALATRGVDASSCIEIDLHDYANEHHYVASFNRRSRTKLDRSEVSGLQHYDRRPVFVPTKEVLSFIYQLVAHYDLQDNPIDETYQDLCADLDAELPEEGERNPRATWAMEEIERICGGRFEYEDGGVEFRRLRPTYQCSSTMAAEGHRKLGVLYRLLQNQVLSPSVSGPLFWDEPEANLNPQLLRAVVQMLFELARSGQQIILSTHDYVLLKEFGVERRDSDQLRFHTLYRDQPDGSVSHAMADDYASLPHNAIGATFTSLYDRDIAKSLGGLDQ